MAYFSGHMVILRPLHVMVILRHAQAMVIVTSCVLFVSFPKSEVHKIICAVDRLVLLKVKC